jgi:energy-coupling factor transport system substrate-specific component
VAFLRTLERRLTAAAGVIPVAVAVNIGVGEVVARLQIPLYLDSVGTVVVAALAGPWAGLITGVLSNLAWGLLLRPTAAPFAVTAAVIGLLSGFLAARGVFSDWWRALLGGLLTGLIAAVVSAPIAAYVFGGVTGGGYDLIVALLLAGGRSLIEAVLTQSIITDLADKAITFLLVRAVLQNLPPRYFERFR